MFDQFTTTRAEKEEPLPTYVLWFVSTREERNVVGYEALRDALKNSAGTVRVTMPNGKVWQYR